MTKPQKLIVLLFAISLFATACDDRRVIVKIDHKYEGCFGYGMDKLRVYHQENEFFAEINYGGKTNQKVRLDRSQLDSLEGFIQELKALKAESGCTTVERYDVITSNGRISKIDGGCSWYGFDRLLDALVGENRYKSE